jgi:hypothetical protein
MSSMQPAEITFPSDVRTILIVDRSRYHDRTVGLLEGIFTGEVLDEDRAGLQAMIEALRAQLSDSERFAIRVATESLPGNSLTNTFPPPLEWAQVDALRLAYQADVVLAVEIFDSDFIVTRGRRMVKKTVTENNQSTEIDVPEFYAEGVANLTIGLRLYDPTRRNLADEELFSRTHSWQATGSNVRDAIVALIDKADAASYVSRDVGADYACKIAPMPIQISRTFYGKSKRVPEMEIGGRHADVGDWREAARVWESGLARATPKDAGQLCYNIAIAHEVLGEWVLSRQWAQRAYVHYGNAEPRDYVAELEYRLRQENLVAQQMQ